MSKFKKIMLLIWHGLKVIISFGGKIFSVANDVIKSIDDLNDSKTESE